MKKTGKRNRESEWITRMSACALTSLHVPLQTLRDTGRLAFTQIQRKIYYRPEDVEKLMVYAAMKRKEKAVREKRKNE